VIRDHIPFRAVGTDFGEIWGEDKAPTEPERFGQPLTAKLFTFSNPGKKVLVPTSGVGQRGKLGVISFSLSPGKARQRCCRTRTKAILATNPKMGNKFLHFAQVY
jgi:hypothetical protein